MASRTFLTYHVRVLLLVAHDPGVRLRDIAASLNITERSAFDIITDLVEAGYVVKERTAAATCRCRPRRDDQPQLAKVAVAQQPGQRGQDRPVGPRQPRRPDVALEHGDLMAQDEDLGVFSPVGPGEQTEPAEYAEHRHVCES